MAGTFRNFPVRLQTSLIELLDQIITCQEGGWELESDPDDRDGGWTYAGMTCKEFAESGYVWDYSTVKDIPPSRLDPITTQLYINKFLEKFDFRAVPPNFIGPYLSCMINCGVGTAAKLLQKVIGTKEVDGVFGPQSYATLSSFLAATPPERLIARFLFAWKIRYDKVCDPSQGGKVNPKYHAGLINRVIFWEKELGIVGTLG